MNEKIIKDYLLIMNISSINQLEENDLYYWHQKRFIEIQRSSSNRELVSKKLIELNTAKDYLDEIDYQTLKKQFATIQRNNKEKDKDLDKDLDKNLDKELDDKDTYPSTYKKTKSKEI